MATFVVCFRLDYDATYSDRWASVVSAIRKQAEGGATWEEMTSMIAFESSKSADSIASSIYISSSLDVTRDAILVADTSSGAYATRGKIDDPVTLARVFSGANALRSIFG